jgi:hypothetical protein
MLFPELLGIWNWGQDIMGSVWPALSRVLGTWDEWSTVNLPAGQGRQNHIVSLTFCSQTNCSLLLTFPVSSSMEWLAIQSLIHWSVYSWTESSSEFPKEIYLCIFRNHSALIERSNSTTRIFWHYRKVTWCRNFSKTIHAETSKLKLDKSFVLSK